MCTVSCYKTAPKAYFDGWVVSDPLGFNLEIFPKYHPPLPMTLEASPLPPPPHTSAPGGRCQFHKMVWCKRKAGKTLCKVSKAIKFVSAMIQRTIQTGGKQTKAKTSVYGEERFASFMKPLLDKKRKRQFGLAPEPFPARLLCFDVGVTA